MEHIISHNITSSHSVSPFMTRATYISLITGTYSSSSQNSFLIFPSQKQVKEREFKNTLALRFIYGFEEEKKLWFTASERKLLLREK